MTDINWAAYIRADNLTPRLCELMVATGMNYFEIGITSGSQELVRKMRMGYNLKTVLQNCRDLKAAGFDDFVSVNYSFNVIDERNETIRQTVAYHRELEEIFGPDKVEPCHFLYWVTAAHPPRRIRLQQQYSRERLQPTGDLFTLGSFEAAVESRKVGSLLWRCVLKRDEGIPK